MDPIHIARFYRALTGASPAEDADTYAALEAEVTGELMRWLRPGIELRPEDERRLERAAARLISARMRQTDGLSGPVKAADVSFTLPGRHSAESECLAAVCDLLSDRDFLFARTGQVSAEGGEGA